MKCSKTGTIACFVGSIPLVSLYAGVTLIIGIHNPVITIVLLAIQVMGFIVFAKVEGFRK